MLCRRCGVSYLVRHKIRILHTDWKSARWQKLEGIQDFMDAPFSIRQYLLPFLFSGYLFYLLCHSPSKYIWCLRTLNLTVRAGHHSWSLSGSLCRMKVFVLGECELNQAYNYWLLWQEKNNAAPNPSTVTRSYVCMNIRHWLKRWVYDIYCILKYFSVVPSERRIYVYIYSF